MNIECLVEVRPTSISVTTFSQVQRWRRLTLHRSTSYFHSADSSALDLKWYERRLKIDNRQLRYSAGLLGSQRHDFPTISWPFRTAGPCVSHSLLEHRTIKISILWSLQFSWLNTTSRYLDAPCSWACGYVRLHLTHGYASCPVLYISALMKDTALLPYIIGCYLVWLAHSQENVTVS